MSETVRTERHLAVDLDAEPGCGNWGRPCGAVAQYRAVLDKQCCYPRQVLLCADCRRANARLVNNPRLYLVCRRCGAEKRLIRMERI